VLVDLVAQAGVELFHTPGGYDSEGYATLPVGDHRETWPIQSKGFRRWLSKRFYDERGKVPGSQALHDAINVLAGKAVHEGPERAVAVRVAEHEGCLWLDLADDSWRSVRIGPDGWEVVTDPPAWSAFEPSLWSAACPHGKPCTPIPGMTEGEEDQS
jgi:hypothetical protein